MRHIAWALYAVIPFVIVAQVAAEIPEKPADIAVAPSFAHVHDADKTVPEALRMLGTFTTALTNPIRLAFYQRL